VSQRNVTPVVSIGTSTIDLRLCDSVLWIGVAHEVMILAALVGRATTSHHLRPVITYVIPVRTISSRMLVASDEATAGSVRANAEHLSVHQLFEPLPSSAPELP